MPRLAWATTLASAFHGSLNDGLAKAVVVSNMTKPHQLSCFDGREERFLMVDKSLYCIPDSVIRLAVPVRNT